MNYIKAEWPAPPHVKAYTTTRTGWGGRRQPFNPADPSPQASTEEEGVLRSLLALPAAPIWLNQIHGAVTVEAAPSRKEQAADASYTAETNRICVITTADCLPVLVCDKKGTRAAAMHAGWRGLSGGIIENTISALNHDPDDLLVWLGPAIGPQKFEVGKDVYDAFTQKHAASAAAFNPQPNDKWLANLYSLARIRLELLGIQHVYGGDYCTYTQEDLFFSYRRDKGKTGRMASLIWIENE